MPVSRYHQDLLMKCLASLQPDDFDHIPEHYANARAHLKPVSQRLIADMFRRLDLLEAFAAGPGTSADQRRLALAAIEYFLRDTDGVHDDSPAGLVDDALVVETACELLGIVFDTAKG